MKETLKKLINRFGYVLSRRNITNSVDVQMQKTLNSCGVTHVIDIGANIGQYSNYLRQIGYKGLITSFEPQSLAYARLLDLSQSDQNWNIAERCALGDVDSEVDLQISDNSVSSSVLTINKTHLNAAPRATVIGQERVKIYKIDTIAPKLFSNDDVFFVKIDAQGFEAEIISGAKIFLQKVSFLQIEVSFLELYSRQKLFPEIDELMSGLGFDIWSIQPNFFNENTGRLYQADVIYVRKNFNAGGFS